MEQFYGQPLGLGQEKGHLFIHPVSPVTEAVE